MLTLESILDRHNMNRALRKVVENKGSAGIDGMETSALHPYMMEHHADLTQSIRRGTYKPQPVRRVHIPKEGGKTRPLGIPTAIDRMVQQAVAQELGKEYEPVFHPSNHGYRPKRGCHTALEQALEYANSGYCWVVDLDLAKFFDTVNHSKLLQIMSERIKDGRVISLVHKMMKAPISENGKLHASEVGTPQGGPVSPMLANILLNELDWELDRRGHVFVRYADDMMILCKSKKAAVRTLASIKPFIEEKLFLRLNVEKSKICRITDHRLKYLGYGFYSMKKGVVKATVHRKSKDKCKAKLRQLTERRRGQSLDTFKDKLKKFVSGWMGHFQYTSVKHFAEETSQWLRRRIRQLYWKQWKRVRTRMAKLQKLGIPKQKAYEWANSRKGYWRIAGSWVMTTALTNDFLKEEGWYCLTDAHQALSR